MILTATHAIEAQEIFAGEIDFAEPALVAGENALSAKVGTVYQVKIEQLHPLQVGFGPNEMKARLEKFLEKSDQKKKKYIRKKPADVTIGPDGNIYLLDGHHMARLLLEAKQPVLLAAVASVHKGGDIPAFFRYLEKKQDVYLYDGVQKIAPKDLPKKVAELKPDAFRDLAWELQETGDIEDVKINFIEFEWARLLFRKKITESEIKSNYASALEKARMLSHSEEAKSLFTGKGYLPVKH